jgi:ribosomal protein S18 acetylase RimI-like enzyme
MIKIKTYHKEKNIRRQLLTILADVDCDFVPPLSTRKPLEFWLDLFELGVVLYAWDEESRQAAGFLAFYPRLDETTLDTLRPYVNVGPVADVRTSHTGHGRFEDAYLHFIAVAPRFRGQKISSMLLEELMFQMDRAAIPRLRVITWSTNRKSLALYYKHRFKVFYRIPDDRGEGIDSIYLEVQRPVTAAANRIAC